jgi:hypothetical protein
MSTCSSGSPSWREETAAEAAYAWREQTAAEAAYAWRAATHVLARGCDRMRYRGVLARPVLRANTALFFATGYVVTC